MTSYYQILGIETNVTSDQIKKAYRQLAMKYHPDRNPGNEDWANEKFKEVNEAFCVLSDPDKKRRYDRFGTTSNDMLDRGFTRDPFFDPRFGIFSDMFGRGRPGCGFGSCKRGFGGHRLNIFDDPVSDTPQANDINREISIDGQTALDANQVLSINGKKLSFKIPPGATVGSKIKLRNARQYVDGVPGDLVITVK